MMVMVVTMVIVNCEYVDGGELTPLVEKAVVLLTFVVVIMVDCDVGRGMTVVMVSCVSR